MKEDNETRPKGEDIGYFDLLKDNLEDIRVARNSGQAELYKRAVMGCLINLDVYLDEDHKKEMNRLDKELSAGKKGTWEFSHCLQKLIIRIIAKQGFIPMPDISAIVNDSKNKRGDTNDR